MMNIKILIVFLVTICLPCPFAHAEFRVTKAHSGMAEDKRTDYFSALITLTLEKTRESYGDYTLETTSLVEWRRFMLEMKLHAYPNLVLARPYRDGYAEAIDADYINIPVDMGLLSYRICFVNSAVKSQIEQAKSLDELRQFTIAQGTNWHDVDILRSNGFKVIEFDAYRSLFKVVIGGRAALYCRGVNELKNEYETYKGMGKLDYDESFVLVYPAPWFFYISSKNPLLKKRIADGLKIAYEDGSLKKLWLNHFKTSIEFARLHQRKVYRLENPQAKNLPKGYHQYLIDPFTL